MRKCVFYFLDYVVFQVTVHIFILPYLLPVVRANKNIVNRTIYFINAESTSIVICCRSNLNGGSWNFKYQ